MADRNTKIRGNQILDATITADEIASSVAGNGLAGGAGSALSLDLNELTDTAIDVSADSFAFVDATDSGSKKESVSDFVTAIAGTGLTATSGVLAVDSITDNIVEGDVVLLNDPSPDSGSTTDYTTPDAFLASSLQVFLNGMLQQVGSGKDYTVAGQVVTFTTAPEAGDIVMINYLKDN